MRQMENIIEFKNVTKIYKLYKNSKKRLQGIFLKKTKYSEKKAINDVSFKIKKGDSVALLGKNGAGKSTLLKMITEVTFPTSGEVIVNGRVSALLELAAGFDQELTGRENIFLKGNILGLNNKEINVLIEKIIEFADIGEYIEQPIKTYSSGMKARLGFSINVNINPEILIVDEALSVGDKYFKKKCINKVTEIMKDGNVTLLFVTHSIDVAKEFCKRGIVLEYGKVICDTTIDEAIKVYDSK